MTLSSIIKHSFVAFIFLLPISLSAQGLSQILTSGKNFYEIQAAAKLYFKDKPKEVEGLAEESSEYAKYRQWEWFWKYRINEDGSFPSLDLNEMNTLQTLQSQQKTSTQPNWSFISQTICDGGYNGMGRASGIAFHPTNANIFYVAAPIGGLWKTTDGGATYTSVGSGFGYGGVSNVLIDESNPNIMYASNGDHSGWWTYTTGVYKSVDGGNTWASAGLNWSLANNVAISKLTMSPTNSQVLFAATTLGLYRTTNGGGTWSLVQSAYHSDVVFRPNDGNVVYTAINDYWGVSQVYKSIDGGSNWTQISNFTDNYNWIQLAVTPANPNKLVVMCSKPNNDVYVSNDNGATFTFKSNAPMGDVIAVSPVNENRMYCGQIVMQQSTDEGGSWTQICDWYNSGSYPEVHADHRFLKFHPITHQLYSCNDGGVYKFNENNSVWTELTNGLLITQFYKIAVSQNDPAFMIGGTQDNGGRKMVSVGTWDETNGGDAMEVAIDPVDDNIFYTTYVDGELYRTLDGWNNDTYHNISDNIPGGQPQGEWVTPYLIDPNNPSRLVAGYHEIYASNNRGNTWTALTDNLLAVDEKFDQLAIFEGDSDIIFASNGKTLYKTTNGGTTWATINPPVNAEISNITLHPTDMNVVWLSYGAYQTGKKVYKSVNGGTSWANYSTGLPNVPVNCLVYVKNSNDMMFAGNDYQVYYRDASMNTWQVYGQGLPYTMITDLAIQYPTNTLRAATYGRGVWEVPVDLSIVSIENTQNSLQPFFVYPNPNTGNFTLHLPPLTENTQLSINNLLGQTMYQQAIPYPNPSQIVLTNQLPQGVYWLTLTNSKGKRSEKIMVK